MWDPTTSQQALAVSVRVKEKLEAMFTKKAPAAAKKVTAAVVPKRRTNIDAQRERNVGIVLQFLRMPPAAIIDAVITLDDEALNEEAVAALVSIHPSAEELKAVQDIDPAVVKDISPTVRYFAMCSKHCFMELKLRCWLSMIRFRSNVDSVAERIRDVRVACSAVQESTGLRSAMHILLMLGNLLNDGVASLREAPGFRLADLQRLKALTDVHYSPNDGSSSAVECSLLAFFVREFASDVSIARLPLELKPVQNACKVDLLALSSDVNELSNHVSMCRGFAAKLGTSNDEAIDTFSAFASASAATVTKLQDEFALMKQDVTSVISYCAEGPLPLHEVTNVMSQLTQFAMDIEDMVARQARNARQLVN